MFEADARFVSLAELLAPAAPAAAVEPAPAAAAAPPLQTPPCARETRDAIRAARIFHAALADAFDALLAGLVRDLCTEVLARELNLQPADIDGIIARLLAERTHDGPLRVRVAAADARAACGIPVVVDEALRAGDAVLECANGSIDARLGVRLADVIAAATP